ncbi:MAG: HRDC domain-containing protein [Anaerolineae bacterium]|nr:HRDC domain-containing protein [Phycisphaerae bacterium]
MRQGSDSEKSRQSPHGQAPASHAAQPADSSPRKSGGLTSWRSAHRSRNHDSAHAEDLMAHDSRVIDHPMIAPGPAPLITDQAALDRLIGELRSAGSFAYDTEFIGELTYHPLLCVIQVATTENVMLIDPMAGLDLRQFWELLADESVEKVVHAGEQDVEPVARQLGGGRGARNVVDTQIAAGFAGLAYPVALSKLVLEHFGVKLGKGLTFTHWDQRPLSPVQLRYAADDVRYLPALWDALRQRVESLGHKEWAIAECREMCDPAQFGFNPDTYYHRVRGAATLSSAGMAVLRELTIWRNAAAREANVPPRALVKDDILIDMARSPIKQIEKLDRVRGLPRPVENEHGQAIVDATQRALASPMAQRPAPRAPEVSPTERFRADSLFAAAGALCAARSVDAGLATSRQEIGEFLRHVTSQDPQAHAALEQLHVMRGWRREALGVPLLNFVRGETAHANLQFIWRDGRLQSPA